MIKNLKKKTDHFVVMFLVDTNQSVVINSIHLEII